MGAKPFAQLAEDDCARVTVELTGDDVDRFAELSGDVNALHLDDGYARSHGFRSRVVHGMLLSAFLSRVLGTVLPGPGTVWLSQDLRFPKAAYVGDRAEITVRVKHKSDALRTLVLETSMTNEQGDMLMTGEAKTMVLGQAELVAWDEMVAVVTGASRGIGAAVARALGEQGARVVVNYRSRRDAAEHVVSDIVAAGGQAVSIEADLSSDGGAGRLADAALDAYGRVDTLINNATPAIDRKPFGELSWEELDNYWRVYVQGAFTLTQRFLPGMKARGFGRVIQILTSAVWGRPPANTAAYVTAKSGLWGLTRSMAVELAPFGVTVNAVSPSAVMTDQWEGEPDSRRRALALSLPARRLASPEDVAATVVFLSGSGGAYLTGANLPVAGGEVM